MSVLSNFIDFSCPICNDHFYVDMDKFSKNEKIVCPTCEFAFNWEYLKENNIELFNPIINHKQNNSLKK